MVKLNIVHTVKVYERGGLAVALILSLST